MLKLLSVGSMTGAFMFSWLLIGDLSSPEGKIHPTHLWRPAPDIPYFTELTLGVFGLVVLVVPLSRIQILAKRQDTARRHAIFIPIFATIGFFVALYLRCVTAAQADLNFSMVAGKWVSAFMITILTLGAIIYGVITNNKTDAI